MSTKLTFQVEPCGATLELEHNLIAIDTWTDLSNSSKLIVGTGNVDNSNPNKLICNAGIDGNPPVVTLLGASWASQLNDTGAGTCDLCQATPSPQKWTVTSRS